MMKTVVMLKAKAGMSPEAFKDYYETYHAPLAVRLYGQHFQDYRRNFVDVEGYRARNGQDPEFNVITEITFASEADYKAFRDAQQEPDNAKAQREDEDKFLDRSVMRGFQVIESVSTLPQR